MHVDDGKTPLWIRGDSTRGLALWPVEDGYVLAVHLETEETPLHLSEDDVRALRTALDEHLSRQDATGAVPVASVPSEASMLEGVDDVTPTNAAPAPRPVRQGPPCDRCKSLTEETSDGYACRSCGNTIMWV